MRKTHPLAPLGAEDREAALRAVDRRLARLVLPGTLLHPLAAVLLLGAVASGAPAVALPLERFALLTVVIAGTRAALGFAHGRVAPRWLGPWRLAVLTLSGTLLLLWGVLAAVLLGTEGPGTAALLALLVCAACAAGVVSVFAAHFAFSAIAHGLLFLPSIVALAFAGGPGWVPLAGTLATCGVFLVGLSHTRAREFWEHRIGTLRLESSVAALERMNRELQQKREQAVDAAATRTRFIANTSHELRTPLHGILGNAELLLAGELESRARTLARGIFDSGRSLLHLVNDVLELARVEAGQIRIDIDAEDPRMLANAVADTVQGLARLRGLTVSLELDRSIPRLLMLDGERYKQILTNLVANAVKFTAEGGVTIAVTYHPESDPPRLETAVKDTGPGIPPQAQRAIFEDFVQLESGPDRRHEGSGLGLAICKRLVEALGGAIGVETAAGGGSTFWFAIPAHPTSAVEHRPRSSGRVVAVKERDGGAARVLVVDDNRSNRELAVEQIRHLGHDADAVDGGPAAFEALERFEYDLVLLDCQMPEIDGYEVARRIRQKRDNVNHLVPIVAVTANAMPEERNRCLQAGMDDYVSKPLDLKLLDRTLNVWIGGDPAELAGGRPEAGAPPPITPARLAELERLQAELGQGAVTEILTAFQHDLDPALARYGTALEAGDRAEAVAAAEALGRLFSELGLAAVQQQLAEAVGPLAQGHFEAGPEPRELAESADSSVAWLRAALAASQRRASTAGD